MHKTIAVASIAFVLICSALSCQYVMPERYVDYNKGRVPVNLPRGLKFPDVDHDIEKSTAVVVTLTADGRIYLGTDHSPIDRRELGARIKRLVELQREDDRIVFLAVDVAANYGELVEACDQIRNAGLERAGLLVSSVRDDWPSRLKVDLPQQSDPNEDLSNLRPNPLTLVATIDPDLTLKLNQDAMGSVNDLSVLSEKLQQIFKARLEQHAYKTGFETMTNLPESDRIEKTLTIKAPRRMKYGDVVKVIDAAKGAGASPIVLQLDDLPD